MLEGAIRLPYFVHTTLHISNFDGRTPGYIEAFGKLVGYLKIAVLNWKLEIRRQTTCPALEPEFAIVIVRNAPLCPVETRFLPNNPVGRFPNPKRIHSAIQPVIHAIIHECLLVFHIPRPTVFGREEFFFVGFAIAVGIGVFINVVRIGFHRQDTIFAVGKHEARKHQLIDKRGAGFINPVVVFVFPA